MEFFLYNFCPLFLVSTTTPKPIKFLTVKPNTRFIFRAITKRDGNTEELRKQVLRAYRKALEEEGIGAKTSVGYGFFKILESAKAGRATHTETSSISASEVVWERAFLNWTPQNQTLTATWKEKNLKASLIGKDRVARMVPEKFHKKLFKQHKFVVAKVTVSQLGNLYEIVKIEE